MKVILKNISHNTYNLTGFNDKNQTLGSRVFIEASEILNFIINTNYSVRHFKYNRRKSKNAQKTQLIILDIDEPQINYPTLDSIKSKLKPYNHILSTTKSHQREKNGVICDRCRIILFCNDFIEDSELYKKMALDTAEYLGFKCDVRCVDLGRFFYKSVDIVSHNFNGNSFELLTVTKHEEKPEVKKDVILWEANIELPKEIMDWIDRKTLGKRIVNARERLIRILIAQRELLIRFDISQEWFSEYLHIKRDTFNVWLQDFLENDWLSIANDSYGKGYKAISYRAEGLLADLIIKYFDYKNRRDAYNVINLPTQIKDGEWHRTIYLSALRFKNDETDENFIRWVQTIPGWDKKTRLKEAYDAFKCMKRYFDGLKEL